MVDISKNSLVMHLGFEETSGTNATDQSPHGENHSGKLRNGAQFRQQGGQFGGAVDFDGLNDYLEIESSQDINLSSHAKRTVSLWFRTRSLGNDKQVIYEEGGTARGLNIYLHEDELYIGGWNKPKQESQWSGTYLSTDAIEEDTWHHVALVLDTQAGTAKTQEGGLTAYIDGKQFGQGSASQLWSHDDPTALGAVAGGTQFHDGETQGNGTEVLEGSLDEVQVYNRALSSEEIAQLAGNVSDGASASTVGMNLGGISYFSPQMPLQNVFKSSRPWRTYRSNGKHAPSWEDDLVLDRNGWVKSLPAENISVATVMMAGRVEDFAAGEYVVLYDGEGTIEYGGATVLDSKPGKDTIDFPGRQALFLEITETDPNQSGNYLRNLRVVPKEFEDTYKNDIFNPEFIEKVDPFPVFRFVNWMEANNSTQQNWSDRPKPNDVTFDDLGTPVEYMVELANRTNSDPWFTLPHKATNEYISNFARYVKENLDPDLNIYVEYSNEVWNPLFSQEDYAKEQGKQEFAGLNLSDNAKKLNWYGKRTTEVIDIWEDVFGGQSERIIGVLGAQSSSLYTAEQPLYWLSGSDPRDKNPTFAPEAIADVGIDAVAVAPYFGRSLGMPNNEAQVESWTNDADGGLNKLFTEITEGGVLNNGPQGGSLERVYGEIREYVQLTEQLGLDLLAYEGGQGLWGTRGVQSNQAITELFNTANRDPRMGDVYREYVSEWFELGGGTFAHFVDISLYDQFGSWGALENVSQDSSPKYDVLLDFVDSAP
ncbi:MAG: LamG domain-containing protein [Cyanophyceae cyanobacterium]